MFLIKERRLGNDYFVFTHTDPRKDGYRGEVIEDVSLDYDVNAIHLWPDREPCPQPQLGRDPADPKHYEVFKFPQELHAAGFEFVHHNTPIVVYSVLDLFPKSAELAENVGENEFFDYLDKIDETTKLRRQKDPEPDPPPGSDRDTIAEWVAKRHLGADGSIRQVVYLPTGAPTYEIRLIEVNERLPPGDGPLKPLDFGIEVAEQAIKVFVADVTKAQLEKLKGDPSSLPNGWSLDNATTWGRRK